MPTWDAYISGSFKGIAAEICIVVPLAPSTKRFRASCGPEGPQRGARPRRLRSFAMSSSACRRLQRHDEPDWAQHIVFSSCERRLIRVGYQVSITGRVSSRAARTLPATPGDRETSSGAAATCRPDRRRNRQALRCPCRANSIGSLTHDIELAPGQERQDRLRHGATSSGRDGRSWPATRQPRR